jgi:hypothetical protein
MKAIVESVNGVTIKQPDQTVLRWGGKDKRSEKLEMQRCNPSQRILVDAALHRVAVLASRPIQSDEERH